MNQQPGKQASLNQILDRLHTEFPDRKPLLSYKNAFQLLIAVALSAQTTDAAVEKVTPELFAQWPTPASLANADREKLEDMIHSLGFYRQKAKNLMAAARLLVDKYNSEVPKEMEELTELPGIGRKSANVIRCHIWNLPGIIVDTHFGRVCRRLGLTRHTDPMKVERELSSIIPVESKWSSP